jgi:maltooligosyltrehalose trehalohydrolase
MLKNARPSGLSLSAIISQRGGLMSKLYRRLPVGAEALGDGRVHFRVWAPKCARVEAVLEREEGQGKEANSVFLSPEGDGYFSGYLSNVPSRARYRFRLNGTDALIPDPASRFQPVGCHGPSEIVEPGNYAWHDSDWPGVDLKGQVLYEMHVGTFTPAGTWDAAAQQLAYLADVGITVIELMPVSEFAGRFGWGYDGVHLFAPTRLYGTPDDFRRFVDQAHGSGIGVILDVVYNHFGPVGNYLNHFSDDFVSPKGPTEWGEAINFDGPNSRAVREFMAANAGYWIDEFHLDGLRLDATHTMHDDSSEHILSEIGRAVRQAAKGRKTIIIAENERQETRLVEDIELGGFGLDGLLNDDFHHAARVAMTGRAEFYLGDYRGTPQELISSVKWGYLYQGQWTARSSRLRGTPAWKVPGFRFVHFLQNHDQIANTGDGRRCHTLTSPGRHRALTALLLLGPATPLLFQGQEYSASTPFRYFADHEPDMARLVREGRSQFMLQFPSLAGPESKPWLSEFCEPRSFEKSKLDLSERDRPAGQCALALHRDLLRLRRKDPVFSAQQSERIHGAVLGPEAFLLRFFGPADDDRLMLINLGRDLVHDPAAEPLLAPPANTNWKVLWSSEDPRYGGWGTPPLDTKIWLLPGHTAIVLIAAP